MFAFGAVALPTRAPANGKPAEPWLLARVFLGVRTVRASWVLRRAWPGRTSISVVFNWPALNREDCLDQVCRCSEPSRIDSSLANWGPRVTARLLLFTIAL